MTTAFGAPKMKSIGAVVALLVAIGCSESEARVQSDEIRRAQSDPVEGARDVDASEVRPEAQAERATPPVVSQASEAERVLLAVAVGGEAGQRIAERMDGLAQTLEGEMEAARVSRVAEGLVVTIGMGILFDEGSDEIAPAALDYLARMAKRLVGATGTDLVVIGHTDRLGSEAENLSLSEERARAAFDVLQGQGVDPIRMTIVGRGESEPLALDDATNEESARGNRRIEIAIYAGEAMRAELSPPIEDA